MIGLRDQVVVGHTPAEVPAALKNNLLQTGLDGG